MSNRIPRQRYIRGDNFKYFPLYAAIEYISRVISGLNLNRLRKEKNRYDNKDKQTFLFTNVLPC
ncbi:MAG: hypothetical protein GWP03_05520 [Proteobacteria bacterium]|nr:hypothetical protein [Pseudomonadota bacterium]